MSDISPRHSFYSWNCFFDLQEEISISTGAHKLYGKAEVSIFNQKLSTWPQITKVQFLYLTMPLSIPTHR